MTKNPDLESNLEYNKARRRVKELKEFYTHAMIFVIVNLGLFLLNLAVSPGIWWFYWSLFGWGIGLAAHALNVYGIGGFFGKDWEERKIQELLQKSKKD